MSLAYTRRMVVADLASAQVVDVVVPASRVWVIRNIIAVADQTTVQTVLGLYAPWPHTVAVALQPANTTQVFNAETRIVVKAGETIHAQAVVGSWHLTVTGYDFAA